MWITLLSSTFLVSLESNLDVSIYAKPEFDIYQMWHIRYGIVYNLNVSKYDKPYFNHWQMSQIIAGLKNNLDVSVYAKPELSYLQMKKIRKRTYSLMCTFFLL